MLKSEERKFGLVSIVDFDGDLNEENCREFGIIIKRLLGDQRICLVLNLEKVSFLGSHALGMILFADKEARERGGQVKLLRPHPMVRMTLQFTRTKFLLEVFDQEQTAVESF